jgi:hypothetical protein
MLIHDLSTFILDQCSFSARLSNKSKHIPVDHSVLSVNNGDDDVTILFLYENGREMNEENLFRIFDSWKTECEQRNNHYLFSSIYQRRCMLLQIVDDYEDDNC